MDPSVGCEPKGKYATALLPFASLVSPLSDRSGADQVWTVDDQNLLEHTMSSLYDPFIDMLTSAVSLSEGAGGDDDQ